MIDKRLMLAAIVCTLTGCAQTQYRASEIPGRYTAKPVRDYSQLDLTPWASQVEDQNSIRAGDRLQVTLDPGTLEQDSKLVWNVSVDENGETKLPNIGSVRVAGMTNAEAEKNIVLTSLKRDVFLTPVVEVQVADRPKRTVIVSGAVGSPGPIDIAEESVSLADLIVRAGGITNAASGKISVSGDARQVERMDEPPMPNAILPVGQKTVTARTISLDSTPEQQLGQIIVPEGSVVHVEVNPPRPIKISGVIRDQILQSPAGENLHLLDAIALAGGQTYSNWISDRVTITRRVPGENRTVRIRGSIRGARRYSEENILLAPHDIVTVEENPMTFTLSTLSGFFGAGVSAAQIGAY